jgi:hypothetical protein
MTTLPGVSVQLGNLAEWSEAVGTVAAFTVTLRVVLHDRRLERERREEAARLDALVVNASVVPNGDRTRLVSGIPTTVALCTIHNDGSRAIGAVDMRVDRRTGEVISECSLATVPARANRAWTFDPPDGLWAATGLDVAWTVTFSDADGRRWRRASDGSCDLLPGEASR